MKTKPIFLAWIVLFMPGLLIFSGCKKHTDESVSSGPNYSKIVYLGSTTLSEARQSAAGSSAGNKILIGG